MKKKLLTLTLVLGAVAASGLFAPPAQAEDEVSQDCFVVDNCGNVCCWVGPRLLCSARPCDVEP